MRRIYVALLTVSLVAAAAGARPVAGWFGAGKVVEVIGTPFGSAASVTPRRLNKPPTCCYFTNQGPAISTFAPRHPPAAALPKFGIFDA
jgi:hypothetical protein